MGQINKSTVQSYYQNAGDVYDDSKPEAIFDMIVDAHNATDAALTAGLATGAITTAKIADGAVTAAKVADGVLTAAKFVAGALTNETANGLEIVALKADNAQRMINVKQPPYNATSNGTTDDTAAIQAAFDAITEGIIYFPDGNYKVTDTLTLTGSNIQLLFSKHAILVTSVYLVNALQIDGDNVTLDGATINSPEQWDGSNTDFRNGVIHTSGSDITIRNCTLNNIYKIGIEMKGGQNILVENNRIHGNFPAADSVGLPGHFGIEYDADVTPNGNVMIQGNFIDTCIQGIFLSERGGTLGYGINISNNVFFNCYNHGIYANAGYGNVISNNNFRQCQVPIAAYGNYTIIEGNNIYTYASDGITNIVGISVREPIGCIIKGNIIKGDGVDGDIILDLDNLALDPSPHNSITNNIIEGNVIEIATGNAIAINIGSSGQTEICKSNIIRNNIIKAPCRDGFGIINISMVATNFGLDNEISGNHITAIHSTTENTVTAIQIAYQRFCKINGNTIRYDYIGTSAQVAFCIYLTNCSYCTVDNNSIINDADSGTNLAFHVLRDGACNNTIYRNNLIKVDPTLATSVLVFDLSGTSLIVERNIVSADTLSGSFSITGTSKVVANANVNAYSKVLVVPKNAAAAAMIKDQGYYITYTAGTGFTIFTGDGVAPAASSDFDFEIL